MRVSSSREDFATPSRERWFKSIYPLHVLLLCACGSSPTAPTPPMMTPPVVIAPPVILPPAFTTDARYEPAFYASLALNGGANTLRRWTRAPLMYLRTIDDQNAPVPASLLDQTAAAFINTTAQFTGAFGLAGLERGTETRAGQPGWMTVQWSTSGVCGETNLVGTEGVVITMNSRRPECTCGPLVAKHELGHALGFYHTAESGPDLMVAIFQNVCDKPVSPREQFHAHAAYTMPVGSRQP